MNELNRRWARAARHVYAGRLIVEVQRLRVARLAAQGLPTYLAEQMLQVFRTTLELLEHCERRRWELAAAKTESASSAKVLGPYDLFPENVSGIWVQTALTKQSRQRVLH